MDSFIKISIILHQGIIFCMSGLYVDYTGNIEELMHGFKGANYTNVYLSDYY